MKAFHKRLPSLEIDTKVLKKKGLKGLRTQSLRKKVVLLNSQRRVPQNDAKFPQKLYNQIANEVEITYKSVRGLLDGCRRLIDLPF